jgi:hypothetical protein
MFNLTYLMQTHSSQKLPPVDCQTYSGTKCVVLDKNTRCHGGNEEDERLLILRTLLLRKECTGNAVWEKDVGILHNTAHLWIYYKCKVPL